MLVIKTKSVVGNQAITGYETCIVVNEAVFKDVVEQLEGLFSKLLVFGVLCERVEFVCSPDRIRRPAGAFEVSEIVPAHNVAVFIDKARLTGQLTVKRDEGALRKPH